MSKSTSSEIKLDEVKMELEKTEQKFPAKEEVDDEEVEEEDSFPELVTKVSPLRYATTQTLPRLSTSRIKLNEEEPASFSTKVQKKPKSRKKRMAQSFQAHILKNLIIHK